MAENLYIVQKTYEALVDPTKDTAIEKDLKFDDTRIFKTEFDRQMYLVSLTGDNLQAAIAWLKDSKNAGVTKQGEMLGLLESKQNELVTIQETTRKALAAEKLVINALLPKANKVEVEVQTTGFSFDNNGMILKDGKLWSGTIDKKDKITYTNGATYFGQVKNGGREGIGTVTLDNWVYVGEQKAGSFEGSGKLTTREGALLEGEWRNDELYTGTSTAKDGVVTKYKDGMIEKKEKIELSKDGKKSKDAVNKILKDNLKINLAGDWKDSSDGKGINSPSFTIKDNIFYITVMKQTGYVFVDDITNSDKILMLQSNGKWEDNAEVVTLDQAKNALLAIQNNGKVSLKKATKNPKTSASAASEAKPTTPAIAKQTADNDIRKNSAKAHTNKQSDGNDITGESSSDRAHRLNQTTSKTIPTPSTSKQLLHTGESDLTVTPVPAPAIAKPAESVASETKQAISTTQKGSAKALN